VRDRAYADFLDRAADPFGLGLLLCELLSGRGTCESVLAVILGSDEYLARS
jgi:hypothetical protein